MKAATMLSKMNKSWPSEEERTLLQSRNARENGNITKQKIRKNKIQGWLDISERRVRSVKSGDADTLVEAAPRKSEKKKMELAAVVLFSRLSFRMGVRSRMQYLVVRN